MIRLPMGLEFPVAILRWLAATGLVFAAVSAPTPGTVQAAAIRPLRGGHAASARSSPRTPAGWLRRAADFTDIRFPGSAPFEMTVTFHAYPGIDFAKKGQSPIMTGDGIYQETWLSPHRWRREVTFGSYHAVEVEADGVRKFQASSDYEPSRVLMLLRALLNPMPRYFLEPQLQQVRLRWKLKDRRLGNLRYVHIWIHQPVWGAEEVFGDHASFDFLPGGALFRSRDINGLVTSWWGDEEFHAHLVPAHLSVQALGRKLVTADVTIGSLPAGETIMQISGKAAEPGMTLRPFDYFLNYWELGGGADIRQESPKIGAGEGLPAGDQVRISAVIDRQGRTREAEWTGLERESVGDGTRAQDDATLAAVAKALLRAFQKSRSHPFLVDGTPCEITAELEFAGGGA